MPSMKISKLFPLTSKRATNGLSGIEVLRESFYRYWNHPAGIVSSRNRASFVRKLAAERTRIMSRFHQYHPGQLWTVDAPSWSYDLRTAAQNRELQKRNWKSEPKKEEPDVRPKSK